MSYTALLTSSLLDSPVDCSSCSPCWWIAHDSSIDHCSPHNSCRSAHDSPSYCSPCSPCWTANDSPTHCSHRSPYCTRLSNSQLNLQFVLQICTRLDPRLNLLVIQHKTHQLITHLDAMDSASEHSPCSRRCCTAHSPCSPWPCCPGTARPRTPPSARSACAWRGPCRTWRDTATRRSRGPARSPRGNSRQCSAAGPTRSHSACPRTRAPDERGENKLSYVIKVQYKTPHCEHRFPVTHSSGAVWESRWPSWAVRPNEPSGFRGRKAILNHASALVTACP